MSHPMTICEKVLARTSGRNEVFPGEFLWPEPDLIIMYDYPGLTDEFERIMRNELKVKVCCPEKCIIFIDHLLPPCGEKEADFHQHTRKWTREHGIKLIENLGIGHQVSAEIGLARPGRLIVHGDMHVQPLGAFGAMTVSLLTDILTPYVLGKFWIEVPESIKVVLTGRFPDGVGGRDLIHCILRDFGPDGAIGAVLEFTGDGAENMSIDDRMTLLSEIMFCGAYCGIFPSDAISSEYLRERIGSGFEPIYPDAGARYKKTVTYDLSSLEPYIITPASLCDAKPVKEAAGIMVHQGYIGSCASGRISDIEIAARILKGRKIKEGFRLNVVPSSREVLKKSIESQALAVLVEAGAFISSPSCDYCYGKTQSLSAGETAVSTGTLNVPGRMGSIEADIYLASAATVAASAISGVICDPREYL